MGRNKECPICRAQIGCKRLLVKDTKTEKLISKILPNLDKRNVLFGDTKIYLKLEEGNKLDK